ncbi:MAG: heat-inducible transcriptional repressor HrcA [Candidatus Marinimicrobia bacterium]|jgi:heat-inducible transcriptional repressor|nr:heat-inducible transcription repressor HrcA [Candidatus Neomarinimicrobiota bacterium]MDP6500129.1 heat-inducible transcriptional repressor HrcA [Candidatus Neomarinimicrobiota bacterium]MDP6726467.1 heat-inducible transcriptional repressor HrcA [Candidatus Neomarinimicrobiota bacterium]|tara:strand:- start:18283 stop:19311 length:1029 start_codon:yes stop_codon:yes gene_type:complete
MYLKKSDISTRQAQVLKAVVEDYIIDHVPIGSNVLKKKHAFNCSSATLRHTMANLEKKNLLMHTYTSSGRIPTDLGYRYYVDHLMRQSDNELENYANVENKLHQSSNSIDDLLKTTAAMLSKISHLFGVAMILQYERSILNEIELVPLSSDRLMVVLGMKSGVVRSIVLNLNMTVNSNEIINITTLLKEKLLGLSLKDIQGTIAERMKDSPLSEHEIVQILLNDPEKHFNIPDSQLIFTSSNRELLDQPEYQQVNNLQKTLEAIDNENVTQYFKTHLNKQNNYMLIGNENMETIYNDCSIVTHVFGGSSFQGQIGIIGPTRIPYANVLRILNNFTEIMNRVC